MGETTTTPMDLKSSVVNIQSRFSEWLRSTKDEFKGSLSLKGTPDDLHLLFVCYRSPVSEDGELVDLFLEMGNKSISKFVASHETAKRLFDAFLVVWRDVMEKEVVGKSEFDYLDLAMASSSLRNQVTQLVLMVGFQIHDLNPYIKKS